MIKPELSREVARMMQSQTWVQLSPEQQQAYRVLCSAGNETTILEDIFPDDLTKRMRRDLTVGRTI